MHAINSVAALALLGLVSAAPASQAPSSGGSFKVTNTPTGNMIPRNGIIALQRALDKHGLPGIDGIEDLLDIGGLDSQNKAATGQGSGQAPSNNAAAGASNGQSGEVAAMSIKNDVEYTSEIEVGGQKLSMDFDTGSSDLWVMNAQMPSQFTTGHTLYDPTKSNNFKQTQGSFFNVSYGDSSFARGNIVGTDTVNIGGAVVNDQVIELPSEVGAEFVQDTSSNGLVGLAFGKLNTVKPQRAQTFFERVKAQLAQPVFTANLKHAATGAYEFGKIDQTQFNGNLKWVPVNTASGFWQFTSANFAVGNGPLLQNLRASPAIADTGTSLMLMDPPVAQTYYNNVPGSALTKAGYVFPNNAQLPDFKFSAGDNQNMITVSGSLLSYTAFNATHMFGGLQSNQNGGTQIMGDIMFKSQFVAFDIGQGQLGFADHK